MLDERFDSRDGPEGAASNGEDRGPAGAPRDVGLFVLPDAQILTICWRNIHVLRQHEVSASIGALGLPHDPVRPGGVAREFVLPEGRTVRVRFVWSILRGWVPRAQVEGRELGVPPEEMEQACFSAALTTFAAAVLVLTLGFLLPSRAPQTPLWVWSAGAAALLVACGVVMLAGRVGAAWCSAVVLAAVAVSGLDHGVPGWVLTGAAGLVAVFLALTAVELGRMAGGGGGA